MIRSYASFLRRAPSGMFQLKGALKRTWEFRGQRNVKNRNKKRKIDAVYADSSSSEESDHNKSELSGNESEESAYNENASEHPKCRERKESDKMLKPMESSDTSDSSDTDSSDDGSEEDTDASRDDMPLLSIAACIRKKQAAPSPEEDIHDSMETSSDGNANFTKGADAEAAEMSCIPTTVVPSQPKTKDPRIRRREAIQEKAKESPTSPDNSSNTSSIENTTKIVTNNSRPKPPSKVNKSTSKKTSVDGKTKTLEASAIDKRSNSNARAASPIPKKKLRVSENAPLFTVVGTSSEVSNKEAVVSDSLFSICNPIPCLPRGKLSLIEEMLFNVKTFTKDEKVLQEKKRIRDIVMDKTFKDSPVRWLLVENLLPACPPCVKCKGSNFILEQNPNFRDGHCFRCADKRCKAMCPVKRLKFMQLFHTISLRDLILLIYHWVCQSTLDEILKDVCVKSSDVWKVYKHLQMFCSSMLKKQKVKLSEPSKSSTVELALFNLRGFYVLGAYNRESKLLRCKTFADKDICALHGYVETFRDWFGLGTVLISDTAIGMSRLKGITCKQSDPHVAAVTNTGFHTLNVKQQMGKVLHHLFGKFWFTGYQQAQVQRALDEHFWKQVYGHSPHDVLKSILNQMWQHHHEGGLEGEKGDSQNLAKVTIVAVSLLEKEANSENPTSVSTTPCTVSTTTTAAFADKSDKKMNTISIPNSPNISFLIPVTSDATNDSNQSQPARSIAMISNKVPLTTSTGNFSSSTPNGGTTTAAPTKLAQQYQQSSADKSDKKMITTSTPDSPNISFLIPVKSDETNNSSSQHAKSIAAISNKIPIATSTGNLSSSTPKGGTTTAPTKLCIVTPIMNGRATKPSPEVKNVRSLRPKAATVTTTAAVATSVLTTATTTMNSTNLIPVANSHVPFPLTQFMLVKNASGGVPVLVNASSLVTGNSGQVNHVPGIQPAVTLLSTSNGPQNINLSSAVKKKNDYSKASLTQTLFAMCIPVPFLPSGKSDVSSYKFLNLKACYSDVYSKAFKLQKNKLRNKVLNNDFESNAFAWMYSESLVPERPPCDDCRNNKFVIEANSAFVDKHCYCCTKCHTKYPVKRMPLLQAFSHIPLADLVLLIYHWICQSDLEDIQRDIHIVKSDISQFYVCLQLFCHEIVKADKMPFSRGQNFATVEVSLAKLSKFYVLGAYERTSGIMRCKVFREQQVHTNLGYVETFKEWFKPGTSIISDSLSDVSMLSNVVCKKTDSKAAALVNEALNPFTLGYVTAQLSNQTAHSWLSSSDHTLNVRTRLSQLLLSLFGDYKHSELQLDQIQKALDEYLWKKTYCSSPEAAFWELMNQMKEREPRYRSVIVQMYGSTNSVQTKSQFKNSSVENKEVVAAQPTTSRTELHKRRRTYSGQARGERMTDLATQGSQLNLFKNESMFSPTLDDMDASVVHEEDFKDFEILWLNDLSDRSLTQVNHCPIMKSIEILAEKTQNKNAEYWNDAKSLAEELKGDGLADNPVKWLVQKNYLSDEATCNVCKETCSLVYSSTCDDGCFWQCNNEECQFTKEFERPCFFAHFPFSLLEILVVIYHWAVQSDIDKLSRVLNTNGFNTRYVWLCIQQLCAAVFEEKKIGGKQCMVEVATILHEKYGVLGAMDRRTKQFLMHPLSKPVKAQEIQHVLESWLHPGSVIVTNKPQHLCDMKGHTVVTPDARITNKNDDGYHVINLMEFMEDSVHKAIADIQSVGGMSLNRLKVALKVLLWRMKYGRSARSTFWNILEDITSFTDDRLSVSHLELKKQDRRIEQCQIFESLQKNRCIVCHQKYGPMHNIPNDMKQCMKWITVLGLKHVMKSFDALKALIHNGKVCSRHLNHLNGVNTMTQLHRNTTPSVVVISRQPESSYSNVSERTKSHSVHPQKEVACTTKRKGFTPKEMNSSSKIEGTQRSDRANARTLISRYTCMECGEQMPFRRAVSHFLQEFSCSSCSYRTHCVVSHAIHNIVKVGGQCIAMKFAKNHRPVKLREKLFCHCGFISSNGNELASHLLVCKKLKSTSKFILLPRPTSSGSPKFARRVSTINVSPSKSAKLYTSPRSYKRRKKTVSFTSDDGSSSSLPPGLEPTSDGLVTIKQETAEEDIYSPPMGRCHDGSENVSDLSSHESLLNAIVKQEYEEGTNTESSSSGSSETSSSDSQTSEIDLQNVSKIQQESDEMNNESSSSGSSETSLSVSHTPKIDLQNVSKIQQESEEEMNNESSGSDSSSSSEASLSVSHTPKIHLQNVPEIQRQSVEKTKSEESCPLSNTIDADALDTNKSLVLLNKSSERVQSQNVVGSLTGEKYEKLLSLSTHGASLNPDEILHQAQSSEQLNSNDEKQSSLLLTPNLQKNSDAATESISDTNALQLYKNNNENCVSDMGKPNVPSIVINSKTIQQFLNAQLECNEAADHFVPSSTNQQEMCHDIIPSHLTRDTSVIVHSASCKNSTTTSSRSSIFNSCATTSHQMGILKEECTKEVAELLDMLVECVSSKKEN